MSLQKRNHTKKEYCTCEGVGTCSGCCLFWCEVCGGAEGELTTECCGRKMTEQEKLSVIRAELDFVNGKWSRK